MYLPLVLSQGVKYIFSLDSLSIIGLCKNYKYPISISEQSGVINMNIDTQKELSQIAKQGCDPAEDTLYLNPIPSVSTVTLVNESGQMVAYMHDSNGRQLTKLSKVQV